MATNMYRVGDYVYFEVSALAPYQIRRIEELNRTATGNVEARVMCFARRRDIDPALLHIADQENKPKEASNEKNEPLAENDCKDEPPKIDSDSKCAPAPDDLPTESTETEKSGDKMEIDDKSDAAAADAKIESNDMDEGKLNTETQESRDARAVSAPVAEKSTDNANEKNENGNEKSPSRAQSVPKEQKMEQGESCEAKESDDKVKIDDGQDMPCAGVSAAKHILPRPGHGGLPIGSETLGAPSIHRLRHRELYLLRQCETLPATHIRGKCTVTLLSEVERPDTFVRAEDSFYYSLVYDSTQKTLLADKGEIRVGDKYQAVIPPISGQYGTEGTKEYCLEEHEKLATCVFNPNAGLRSNEVDQFMILARSVGTLARALDSSSSVKMPGLHTSAVAASRDVTLLNALNLLHKANYDWGTAMRLLVPMVPTSSGGNTEKHPADTGPSSNSQAGEFANANAPGSKRVLGPVLCRDQLEEWSAAEANLFEEAVEKCGKEFSEIRNDMS